MNKKAGIIVQVLIILIFVVLTSALIIFLVKTGVISVKGETEEVRILNADFLPYGISGTLVVKEFNFCSYVDELYICTGEGNEFYLGDEVHFRFIVESSTYNGEIMLIENYRVIGPDGQVLLEVDDQNNYNFDIQSKNKVEQIVFKDYFTVSEDALEGEYTLELFLENPLMDKNVKLVEKLNFETFYVDD